MNCKKVFVVSVDDFDGNGQILKVCQTEKQAKCVILEFLQMIHFDNGLTKLDVEQFVEKHIDNFDENFKELTFPDDFEIWFDEVEMI